MAKRTLIERWAHGEMTRLTMRQHKPLPEWFLAELEYVRRPDGVTRYRVSVFRRNEGRRGYNHIVAEYAQPKTAQDAYLGFITNYLQSEDYMSRPQKERRA